MRKLAPHIKKLIMQLKDDNISFSFDTDTTTNSNGKSRRLENVIFEKNSRKYKLYEGYFFRDFGQCVYFKMDKGEIILSNYTNDIFYDDLMLSIKKYFKK